MGTLILPGKPQTYKPLRFFRGQIYAPHSREKKKAQRILDEQATLQRPGAPPLRQAVKVDVILDFKRPKSHWSKNQPATGQLKASASEHVIKKPDVDNCLKFVQDALEPTVIENDKLVVSATVTKLWCSSASEERTDIELLIYRD